MDIGPQRSEKMAQMKRIYTAYEEMQEIAAKELRLNVVWSGVVNQPSKAFLQKHMKKERDGMYSMETTQGDVKHLVVLYDAGGGLWVGGTAGLYAPMSVGVAA
jgi:hypothetical protein